MAYSNRKWTEGMFRHMRRGRYDQALFHAVRGDPKMMLKYYEERDGHSATPTDTPSTPSPSPDPQFRNVQINGVPLSEEAWEYVLQLEQIAGAVLPDGTYWYDAVCGAFGVWGQGTWLFLPPNLPLGGPIPPHCSGPPTGIVINGRDLHPFDMQRLAMYAGPLFQGHYYLDAWGNLGVLGQAPFANLRILMGG